MSIQFNVDGLYFVVSSDKNLDDVSITKTDNNLNISIDNTMFSIKSDAKISAVKISDESENITYGESKYVPEEKALINNYTKVNSLQTALHLLSHAQKNKVNAAIDKILIEFSNMTNYVYSYERCVNFDKFNDTYKINAVFEYMKMNKRYNGNDSFETIIDKLSKNRTPISFVEKSIEYLNNNPQLLEDSGYEFDDIIKYIENPNYIHSETIDVYTVPKDNNTHRFISVGSKYSNIIGRLYNNYLNIKLDKLITGDTIQKYVDNNNFIGFIDLKSAYHSIPTYTIIAKLLLRLESDTTFDGHIIKHIINYIKHTKYNIVYNKYNTTFKRSIPGYISRSFPIFPGNSVGINLFAYMTNDIVCDYKYVDDFIITGNDNTDINNKFKTFIDSTKSIGLKINKEKSAIIENTNKDKKLVFYNYIGSLDMSRSRKCNNHMRIDNTKKSHTFLGYTIE